MGIIKYFRTRFFSSYFYATILLCYERLWTKVFAYQLVNAIHKKTAEKTKDNNIYWIYLGKYRIFTLFFIFILNLKTYEMILINWHSLYPDVNQFHFGFVSNLTRLSVIETTSLKFVRNIVTIPKVHVKSFANKINIKF